MNTSRFAALVEELPEPQLAPLQGFVLLPLAAPGVAAPAWSLQEWVYRQAFAQAVAERSVPRRHVELLGCLN
jgi:hypothetical protein